MGFDLLKESCSIRDKARLNTISEPHAGAWLTAIPNPNLGLAISRHEFTIAVHLWLGRPLFSSPPNAVRCICGKYWISSVIIFLVAGRLLYVLDVMML